MAMHTLVTPSLWEMETGGWLKLAGCQPSSGFIERTCFKGQRVIEQDTQGPLLASSCIPARTCVRAHTLTLYWKFWQKEKEIKSTLIVKKSIKHDCVLGKERMYKEQWPARRAGKDFTT